jgi:hypothetical protein
MFLAWLRFFSRARVYMRGLKLFSFGFATMLNGHAAPAAAREMRGVRTVAQCVDVRLSAAYLARSASGAGPGFLLTIRNDRDRAIRIAEPFPTSAHWYAEGATGHLLWRASSGSGGELVDALRERGPMFAYQPPVAARTEYITVEPYAQLQWAASIQSNPALIFRPGCERCSNPEDKRFVAVLAYAYVPPPGPEPEGLLTCGLRSGPVIMPPLE